MKRSSVAAMAIMGALSAGAMLAPVTRADYAILRSGERLHITGYETVGDHVRLSMPGGTLELPADALVCVEPVDVFQAIPEPSKEATAPYDNFIHEAAVKHGVDEKLIRRVIAAESNFNPKAVSRKQAQGLMQLMPQTATQYSVGNVFDPAQNIDGGTRYLKDLLQKYSGNVALALAAYNAGPELVQRYGGVPPFAETRKYVKKITSELAKASPTAIQ
jgi:hypothetical protein